MSLHIQLSVFGQKVVEIKIRDFLFITTLSTFLAYGMGKGLDWHVFRWLLKVVVEDINDNVK